MGRINIPSWEIQGSYRYSPPMSLEGRSFEVALRFGYSSRIPRFKNPDNPSENYHSHYREMAGYVDIVECIGGERRPVTPGTRLWAYLAKKFVRTGIQHDPYYPKSRLVEIVNNIKN